MMEGIVERLREAYGYGASYSRDKASWAIYEMPPLSSPLPYKTVAETQDRDQMDFIVGVLRLAKGQEATIQSLQADNAALREGLAGMAEMHDEIVQHHADRDMTEAEHAIVKVHAKFRDRALALIGKEQS